MQYNIHDAKSQLSKLVKAAMNGERVIIAHDKVPVVEIIPLRPKKPFKFGLLKDVVKTAPDFFEPMSEEDLRLWEGDGDSPEKNVR